MIYLCIMGHDEAIISIFGSCHICEANIIWKIYVVEHIPWNFAFQYSPTNDIFRNFALDSHLCHRVGVVDQTFCKKVLLKFYLSLSNLAVWIVAKVRLAIAPASVAYTLLWMADYMAILVWGYCFICYKGTPRPDNEIKQDTSSHLFYVQWYTPEEDLQVLIQFMFFSVKNAIRLIVMVSSVADILPKPCLRLLFKRDTIRYPFWNRLHGWSHTRRRIYRSHQNSPEGNLLI